MYIYIYILCIIMYRCMKIHVILTIITYVITFIRNENGIRRLQVVVLEKHGLEPHHVLSPLPAHTDPHRIFGRLRSWQVSRRGQPPSHKHNYKRLVVIPVPSKAKMSCARPPNARIASPKQDPQGPEIQRNPCASILAGLVKALRGGARSPSIAKNLPAIPRCFN